ncbi:hypothetical protein JHK82_031070 [Glycine max]|nr:hypothetical protein JHK85_031715 [Glycine max]KAG5124333.1 hypothetical protein JHK82_031070 [Glycine max]
MEADLPLSWKPLNLERYDGTTNENEHPNAFLTLENLYTNDNTILCRVFLTSLKRATLIWYRGLPPRPSTTSIFLSNISVLSMQPAVDKSLQKFMDRFGRIVVQIRNLNPEVALHSMLLVLRPGKFVDSLCKQKASQQHGRVTRTSQRLHLNGGDVKVQKRGPTGRTEAGQKRRTHQDRLTQVRQKAQAR